MKPRLQPIADRLAHVAVDVGGGSTCNVFVIGTATDCVLIDASTAETAKALVFALAEEIKPGGVKALIVTHGHADHYGGLAGLTRWSSAPSGRARVPRPALSGRAETAPTHGRARPAVAHGIDALQTEP